MKPAFTDLSLEQQAVFGNGCTWVPDWVFTPSCRVHDFIFGRGCGANYWYENLWKAPYYYTRGNWHFFILMWGDAIKPWHYAVAITYFVGVMLFSWRFFVIGRWRTIEEIVEADNKSKSKKTCGIMKSLLHNFFIF